VRVQDQGLVIAVAPEDSIEAVEGSLAEYGPAIDLERQRRSV